MIQKLTIPPPSNTDNFSPSDLFRFFFQIGHWTEDSFCSHIQNFIPGSGISTVTISKWKNRNVIPKRYATNLFLLIDDVFEKEISEKWKVAFETVWAHHASRPRKSLKVDTTKTADGILLKHRKWIHKKYHDQLMGEKFSAVDIYVPLQIAEIFPSEYKIYDSEELKSVAMHGWQDKTSASWTFITGGPGSGKSMAALHLAHHLSDSNVFQIYLRVSHLSDIEIDSNEDTVFTSDSYSVRSFLKHFRASTHSIACLILDGLDEIGGNVDNSLQSLTTLVTNLRTEQNICEENGKTLRIIALGRDARTGHTIQSLCETETKSLHMISLAGTLRLSDQDRPEIVGTDFRPLWWERYLAAKGLPECTTLPDFLYLDYNEFSEFGLEPLLTYLICRTAFPPNKSAKLPCPSNEWVNRTTFAHNKNSIYKQIIEQVRQSDIWRPKRIGKPVLDEKNFRKVLQYIALASWHEGSQRKASLKVIEACIQENATRLAFQDLVFSSPGKVNTQTDNMITTFYYRVNAKGEKNEENQVEFTHKTFSEYLLSTLIFDKFIALINAYETRIEFDDKLEDWIALCYDGVQSPTLADFCQNEAALRFSNLNALNWNIALELIPLELFRHSRQSKDSHKSQNFIRQQKLAGNLLFFIWSCFNRERFKHSQIHFPLFDEESDFTAHTVKLLQPITVMKIKKTPPTDIIIENLNWLGHALSGIKITSTDMSTLSLTTGHIENLSSQKTKFAMTNWNQIKISNSVFMRSIFQHASFNLLRVNSSVLNHCLFQFSKFDSAQFEQTKFNGTIFSQCHFHGINFDSCEMQDVVFDRCIFTNALLQLSLMNTHFERTTFRHCTFVDMQDVFENISEDMLEHCHFEAYDIEKASQHTSLEKIVSDSIFS